MAQAKQVETTSLLVLAAQTPTTSASGPLSPTVQVSSSSRSSYYLLALETTVQSSQITLTELIGYRLQLQKPGEASPLVTRYSASAPVEVGVGVGVAGAVPAPNPSPGSNSIKLRSLFVISAPVTSASVPGSTKIETEADVVLRDNLNTLLWKDTLTWERLSPGAYSIPYSLTITDNLVSGRRELVRPELPDWAGELLAKSGQPELIALAATTDANFGSNQKVNPPLTITKRNPLALLSMGLLVTIPALLILVHLFQTGQAPISTFFGLPARAGTGTGQTQRGVGSKSASSLKITKPGLSLNPANIPQTLADDGDAEQAAEDTEDISDAELGKVPATLAPVSSTPKVAAGTTGNDRPASLAQSKSTSVSVSVKPQVRDADADDEVELAEWDIEDEVEADEGEDEDVLDLDEDVAYSLGSPGKSNRFFSGRLPTVPKPGSSSGSSPVTGDANYTSNGNGSRTSQAPTSAGNKKGQGLVSVFLPKKLPGAKAAMSQAGALESGAEARVFEMLKAHGASWLLADSLDINKQFALKSLSRLGGLAVSYSRKEASYMNNGASLDFLLEARRGSITRLVAVEVDGPWHGLAKQQGRDKMKDAVLEKAKIPVIRIPTGDISQASLQQAFSSLVSNPAVRFWPA